jgi:hypothetical protein
MKLPSPLSRRDSPARIGSPTTNNCARAGCRMGCVLNESLSGPSWHNDRQLLEIAVEGTSGIIACCFFECDFLLCSKSKLSRAGLIINHLKLVMTNTFTNARSISTYQSADLIENTYNPKNVFEQGSSRQASAKASPASDSLIRLVVNSHTRRGRTSSSEGTRDCKVAKELGFETVPVVYVSSHRRLRRTGTQPPSLTRTRERSTWNCFAQVRR